MNDGQNIQVKQPYKGMDGFAFVDGEMVPVTWPIFGEDQEPIEDAGQEALHWLRQGLLVVLDGGRSDGIASRAAALAVIAGLFESTSHAAERLGLDRKAVSRAYEVLVKVLKSQAENNNNIENKGLLPPPEN